MTFTEIYHQVLPLWGPTLRFADGVTVEHKNPFRTLGKLKGLEGATAAADHFYSEDFSRQWKQTDEAAGKADPLRSLMVWSMYEVFHRHAQERFARQVFTLAPAEVDPQEIEAQFLKNLHQEGWEEERARFDEGAV